MIDLKLPLYSKETDQLVHYVGRVDDGRMVVRVDGTERCVVRHERDLINAPSKNEEFRNKQVFV